MLFRLKSTSQSVKTFFLEKPRKNCIFGLELQNLAGFRKVSGETPNFFFAQTKDRQGTFKIFFHLRKVSGEPNLKIVSGGTRKA